MDLADARDAERGREHALADLGLRFARLDVDDDVEAGKPLAERVLDAVGGGVALADGRARSDPDVDVDEVRAAGLAHAQPPELDGRVERRDRLPRRLLRFGGRVVHEHVDVPAQEPAMRRRSRARRRRARRSRRPPGSRARPR